MAASFAVALDWTLDAVWRATPAELAAALDARARRAEAVQA